MIQWMLVKNGKTEFIQDYCNRRETKLNSEYKQKESVGGTWLGIKSWEEEELD